LRTISGEKDYFRRTKPKDLNPPPRLSGEPRPWPYGRKYPVWGASGSPDTRRLSDDHWIILDALLFLTASPGKAGLPG
jgi:hypothetical protein